MFLRLFILVGLVLLFNAQVTPICAQTISKEADQLDFAQGLLSRGLYDLAVSQYQKFITEYPQSPSIPIAYISIGESYFQKQDFKNARDAFKQFKERFSASEQLPLSVLRLAQIDIQEKNFDAALQGLLPIGGQEQLKPSLRQSIYYYTAQAYLGKRDSDNATTFFNKAIQVNDASDYTSYAYKEIGNIETAKGHYPQAREAYSKAVGIASDDALKGELIYRSAQLAFLMANYQEARNSFSAFIDQYPKDALVPEAMANLLLAYFNMGQYQPLIDYYQQKSAVLENTGSFFGAHLAAIMAYIELKQFDKADALLDRALGFKDLKPEAMLKIYLKKADIQIRLKQYTKAMDFLNKDFSMLETEKDEFFFLKGQAFFGLGDFDKAFNAFENVNLNFPMSRFVKASLLGEAHTRQKAGRFKEAADLFLKYYDVETDTELKMTALYDVIVSANKAVLIPTVMRYAGEYLKSFPKGADFASVVLILADNYSKGSQWQAAIRVLQDFLNKPESAGYANTINFFIGVNQQHLGVYEEALKAYAKIDDHQDKGDYYAAALKNMAIINLAQKNFDAATTYFDRLINLPKRNDLQVKTYIWICNEFLKEHRYADVLRTAQKAVARFAKEDLKEINYFNAEALRGLDKCPEAIQVYQGVIASNLKDSFTGSAHIGYGLCLAKADKLQEAEVQLQTSLDENADDNTVSLHARFELAQIERKRGNRDQALKFYLLVATLYDDLFYTSQSLLSAGQIQEELNNKTDARKLYTEIVAKYKNSAAYPLALKRLEDLK